MRISDWSSDVCSSDLIAPFEGGLAAFYAHPVIQRGLAGRQACQTERGRALHACLAIVIAPLAYLGTGQVGAQLHAARTAKLSLAAIVPARCLAQARHNRACRQSQTPTPTSPTPNPNNTNTHNQNSNI